MKVGLFIVQWNKKEDSPLRKVILTINEEFTYQHIKHFVDQGSSQQRFLQAQDQIVDLHVFLFPL